MATAFYLLWLAACSSAPNLNGTIAITHAPPASLAVAVGIAQLPGDQLLVGFTFRHHDAPVQLAPTVRLTCAGQHMVLGSVVINTYSASIPATVADPLHCQYVASSAAPITFTVPLAHLPILSAPTTGAHLPRTVPLILRYPAQSGCCLRAGIDNGLGTAAFFGPPEATTGTYLSLDPQQMQPGPGTIVLQRIWDSAGTDPAFQSLTVHGMVSANVPVVWG